MQIELNNYRIRSNHGTSDEWNNKPGFIPLEGEIILYTDLRKFKVGDGRTVVGALDFYSGDATGEIRFSASADGANMTTTWSEGQAYIGFLNDATAPNDPASYTWCQFITSYTPSGWTVDQISKLEQIFNALVYTNTSTQAVADALIASLRSGSGGDTPVITWTLTALEVLPTSITVPAGTTADNIKTYLTSMTGTYQSSDGQTQTRDLTSKISETAVSGTMPTAGNTASMTITYDGKSTTVSVTMEAAAPTITGLTVTYTGGTVAAGTTLSQLTEVVKATYSNGSTSAALIKGTDYTLSGTLTAGQTNTVTVTGTGTYAGHATSFLVTVAAEITLSHLKVTYDNNTAVAAGTTLEQLNEVVKAVYSDNSESAALIKNTDYVLSGILAAGQTNTITVTGKGAYAELATVTFEVTVQATATTTHTIAYDSVVDGTQTVAFTPMLTEVNDGASTTINMEAKALTASYYEHATGIAINEVRKSSVKVGTDTTTGTNTLTISNQKADATVTAVPTLMFNATNQAYTDGEPYAPHYSGYVGTCVSGLYELKAGKHYIYTDGGSGKKFRVAFVRADYTAMGGSAEQVSGTTIKLGGANSDLAVPANAKYFFLRYSSIDKNQTVVQTTLAKASMLLECE